MSHSRRIRRRRRIFVGCEGSSERGYIVLLQRFANREGCAVHIEARNLSGAGDPLALAQRASAEISVGEQQPNRKCTSRFLMFDTDRVGQNPDRDDEFRRIVNRNRLILIRQQVCFESLLLRHFDGHSNDRPATSSDAFRQLKKVWPEYRKGMLAADLAKQIDLGDVERAAKSAWNRDLRELLAAIGLVKVRGSRD